MRKKKTNNCQQFQRLRTNEEYFNYKKKRYYAYNYYLKDLMKKFKDEKAIKKAKQT